MMDIKNYKTERRFALLSGLFLLIPLLILYLLVDGLLVLKTLLAMLAIATTGLALAHQDFFIPPTDRLSTWQHFGLILHQVTTPAILGLVYYGCFLPVGLLLRLSGKDPLNRRKQENIESYWVSRNPPGPEKNSIKLQF